MTYEPHTSHMDIPASPREVKLLRDLFAEYRRAERDLTVAFSQFCASHDVPDLATLQAIGDASVRVDVPEPVGRVERALTLEP